MHEPITKWVTEEKEDGLEKLVNVYQVLSREDCNIGLIFHREHNGTDVYLSVTNAVNSASKTTINMYMDRLIAAVRGNFPGSEFLVVNKSKQDGDRYKNFGKLPFLENGHSCSVATITNIPTEKSEKFISQTIEKLLDGIVPSLDKKTDYTIILLAAPILDIEERKIHLSELYSALAPYAGWQTNFTFTDSSSSTSMATFGLNVGANVGMQNGKNSGQTMFKSEGDSSGTSEANTESNTTGTSTSQAIGENSSVSEGSNSSTTIGENSSVSEGSNSSTTIGENSSSSTGTSTSHADTKGSSDTVGGSVGGGIGIKVSADYHHGWNESATDTVGKTSMETLGRSSAETMGRTSMETLGRSSAETIGRNTVETLGKSLVNTVASSSSQMLGRTVTSSLTKALTRGVSNTIGKMKNIGYGLNFGANFARASNVTATVGKNEGITQNFTNYNIKHALEKLDMQMKRFDKSSALGFWDFAAYVISEDPIITNNVAHVYLALTQGEESFLSQSAINTWRGDIADSEESAQSKVIMDYLKELRHPLFCINPNVVNADETFNQYPTTITSTTGLSGKELSYSLNFPKKSISGLPVIECASFGRNISVYDSGFKSEKSITLGKIYHMHRNEDVDFSLNVNSLASHTFITGSTGSGKSNMIYKIIEKLSLEEDEYGKNSVHFLVIEPAKGEYKNIFRNNPNVAVYGTNSEKASMLKLNPFCFPKEIHILEHLDRLIEIFNVCWPMYAAMPAVLKEAVEKAYEDTGWDLCKSVNSYGNNLYPTFSDVMRNIKIVIENSEYDAENKGAYKGSLITRLKSLTNGINGLIFTSDEISNDELFDKNVIVDLSRVGSSETKSLIIGILVLKLQEYRMTSGLINSSLRHVTVLEEAHNLLKRTSTIQTQDSGNLAGKSVEMLTNAIAEMRTYGEGFIIADQAPGLLDLAVIRNTNTKIIMRLPDEEDRELVGRAANLNDEQITELAKLPRGVAAVYQNEWIEPVLCYVFKADSIPSEYGFVPLVIENKQKPADYSKQVKLANMLFSGENDDTGLYLKDLQELKLSAYTEVLIRKYMDNPVKSPKYTKLSNIVKELFPVFYEKFKQIYGQTADVVSWTDELDASITETLGCTIDETLRRDLRQCIILQYVYNELGNAQIYKEWLHRG